MLQAKVRYSMNRIILIDNGFDLAHGLKTKYTDIIDKFLEDKNQNKYLENIKSIKYLESRSYTELSQFIDSDVYDILILGHSCGISDRTLLKKLFKNKNCLSIKIYYHKKMSGYDNYSDIARNISRNFIKTLILLHDSQFRVFIPQHPLACPLQ